jgi:hypothetical protein
MKDREVIQQLISKYREGMMGTVEFINTISFLLSYHNEYGVLKDLGESAVKILEDKIVQDISREVSGG